MFLDLVYKFTPYWPLFLTLLVISCMAGWAYLNYYATPVYEASASLLIKDEKKGVNDSKMTESIDAFITSKIVENEINVIHSRTLMKQVVNKLSLYAPIYEEGKFKSTNAYTSSPIRIKLKNPEDIKQTVQVYFTYNNKTKKVKFDGMKYPLNEWVDTPYGEMKFSKNKNMLFAATNPLYFTLQDPRKVTDQLVAKLTIVPSGKLSTVVDIRLRDEVPERSEDILNYLINSYNDMAVLDRNELAANTLDFVESRIQLVEKELKDLENEVVHYKATNGAVDLNEQGKLYLRNIGDNDRRISEISNHLSVLDQIEKFVVSRNSSTGSIPSTLGINDPILSDLLQKLQNLEIQYQKLKNTTAENNPILISLAEEIGKVKPGIIENIRTQRVNLKTSLSNLMASNGMYNSAIQSIPHKEKELLDITRQQAIKNDAYSFLLQKREETVLAYAPTAGSSSIVDLAEASLWPVSPKPLYVYLTAIFVALAMSIGFVMGKEMMNSKVLFRSEIKECTNAPIVAELSNVKFKKDEFFKVSKEPVVVEQFRQMRATMGLYGRNFVKKKIMVTSSIPGEGKSFVSANLSLSLAASGKKVVLLDFDMRNPNTSLLFNVFKQDGLIEFLDGSIRSKDMIISTDIPNLFVVSAGVNIGDHTEVLLNGKVDELFAYLETEFDYIIIDTPPVDLVSDAYLLSEYCDITLLVIRHAFTPKSLVQRFTQNNKLESLKNAAIVFNGVKPRGFIKGQYGYGYGYGFDNKYGNKVYAAKGATAKA
ncbi:polysaccharide biosynthesis tyrosine autokinase [Pontibacter qinzhouensis]|uniref:non-specific protein-tyrosine kinase n=1 Tax=Pontibacter qinzhouensis TaxID=2603253 RepID=A0A5C8KAD6_9BACT|nr:tyrosine-protein kinase [Pontibacter qinzhouensis]TXK46773.1 polysaccharide biosynthesis tyrosine autokinase [Pontibacter qinzhouensis]